MDVLLKRFLLLLLVIFIHLAIALLVGPRYSKDIASTLQKQSQIQMVFIQPSDGDKTTLPLASRFQASTRSFSVKPSVSIQEPSHLFRGIDAEAITSLEFLPEPHYFKLKELTEKPSAIVDAISDQVLVVPDPPSQPIVAKLFINELRLVDKVMIDEVALSEEGKKVIIDTFKSLKFLPGKLNDHFVKSQLEIEVILEAE